MIGLAVFLLIIATLMTLIEAALLTYVFHCGAYRQSLVFAPLSPDAARALPFVRSHFC